MNICNIVPKAQLFVQKFRTYFPIIFQYLNEPVFCSEINNFCDFLYGKNQKLNIKISVFLRRLNENFPRYQLKLSTTDYNPQQFLHSISQKEGVSIASNSAPKKLKKKSYDLMCVVLKNYLLRKFFFRRHVGHKTLVQL